MQYSSLLGSLFSDHIFSVIKEYMGILFIVSSSRFLKISPWISSSPGVLVFFSLLSCFTISSLFGSGFSMLLGLLLSIQMFQLSSHSYAIDQNICSNISNNMHTAVKTPTIDLCNVLQFWSQHIVTSSQKYKFILANFDNRQ